MIFPYCDLDEEARKQVWKNFIARLPSHEAQLSNGDFDELAKTKSNGRDIKNLIKTALILSVHDKPLRISHFKVVLGIRKRVHEIDFGHSS